MTQILFRLSIYGFVLGAAALHGQRPPDPNVDDSWGNLMTITRDRPYTVIQRDGRCLKGRIADVMETTLTLRVDSKQERTIDRAEVMRVADTLLPPVQGRDIIFSGRSSWRDVHLAFPGGSEYWHVTTLTGEELDLRKWAIGEGWIVAGGRKIPKGEVRRIYYVRYEPLTAYELSMHPAHLDLLAPSIWFRGAMLGKIRVRLYDSSLVEDNSQVVCDATAAAAGSSP